MPVARITLKAVGYPNVAPNSLLVLQSLQNVGFDIVLRNVKYKDKNDIIEYFHNRFIRIKFISVKDPDIDLMDDKAIVGIDTIENSNVDDIWEKVDKLCLQNQVYERDDKGFVPSYKKDTFFFVTDYCLSTQNIDSRPVTMRGALNKGSKLMAKYPNIQSLDLVDSVTLQVVRHFDRMTFRFEPATETCFFNIDA